MNMKSKQTIGIVLLAAAIITSLAWFKSRNKKTADDYDWIMWQAVTHLSKNFKLLTGAFLF